MILLFSILLIHILRCIFFKPDNTVLSCGIFGFSLMKGRKADIKKTQILGIYNTERGTDSCGYYYNGNIEKGVGINANWSRFVVNKGINKGEIDTSLFIGHTRKSTIGQHTEENAHPFVVNNLVLAHNGVIRNIWELAREQGITYNQYTVDSHGLALVINAIGFEALTKYKGFAALAMTFTDDPESLYLYHGAVRQTSDMKLHEERPLFILKQPEGVYFSSIKESLQFINSNPKKYEIEIVPHNNVIKITNGELTDFSYKVNREEIDMPVKVVTDTTVKQLPSTTSISGFVAGKKEQKEFSFTKHDEEIISSNLIHDEDVPDEAVTQDIFFWQGRFWLSKSSKEYVLADGIYKIDRKGIIENHNVDKNFYEADIYFFIKGIMIDTEKKYRAALLAIPDIKTNLKQNTAYQLSPFSRYPVSALSTEALNVPEPYKFKWYKNHKAADGKIDVKFSKRVYKIENGKFISVQRPVNSSVSFKKDNKEEDWINIFTLKILGLCCQNISIIDDYKDINENFLEFIDYFNACNSESADEKTIKDRTSVILRYLIKAKISFFDYLKETNNNDFCKKENILKCFIDHTKEDIIDGKNRYQMKSLFADIDDDETDEVTGHIQDIEPEDMTDVNNLNEDVADASDDCCSIQVPTWTQPSHDIKVIDLFDGMSKDVENYKKIKNNIENVYDYMNNLKNAANDLYDSNDENIRDMGKVVIKALDSLRSDVESREDLFNETINPNTY